MRRYSLYPHLSHGMESCATESEENVCLSKSFFYLVSTFFITIYERIFRRILEIIRGLHRIALIFHTYLMDIRDRPWIFLEYPSKNPPICSRAYYYRKNAWEVNEGKSQRKYLSSLIFLSITKKPSTFIEYFDLVGCFLVKIYDSVKIFTIQSEVFVKVTISGVKKILKSRRCIATSVPWI